LNRFSLLLAILLTVGTVSGKPRRATPTPTPVKVPEDWVCRTHQQDLELRDWINGIMTEAQKAQASNAQTKTQLDASVKAGQDLANECAADKACSKAPLSCWFHRLIRHIFWILGAIIVILIALVVASIFFPALAPILGFLLSIWKWILGLFTRKPPTP
jgi:hypothetical protein